MSRNLVVIVITLILGTVIGGCATTAQSEWKAPRPANAPYENMLVVAVSWTQNLRRDVEELVVDELANDQTRVLSSYRIEAEKERRYQSKEHVLELIQETGADSLLVIWMVSEEVEMALTQAKGYIDYGPQVTVYEHPHMTEIWVSDYTVKETQQLVTDDIDIRMEAVLYDVEQNAHPIYAIDVETKYEETGSDSDWIVATRMSEAIGKKLRGAGLVKD